MDHIWENEITAKEKGKLGIITVFKTKLFDAFKCVLAVYMLNYRKKQSYKA